MQHYDIAIVGAGIIGCAIARQLSRYELSIAVVEAANDGGVRHDQGERRPGPRGIRSRAGDDEGPRERPGLRALRPLGR